MDKDKIRLTGKLIELADIDAFTKEARIEVSLSELRKQLTIVPSEGKPEYCGCKEPRFIPSDENTQHFGKPWCFKCNKFLEKPDEVAPKVEYCECKGGDKPLRIYATDTSCCECGKPFKPIKTEPTFESISKKIEDSLSTKTGVGKTEPMPEHPEYPTVKQTEGRPIFVSPKVTEFLNNSDALSQDITIFKYGGKVGEKEAIKYYPVKQTEPKIEELPQLPNSTWCDFVDKLNEVIRRLNK